VSLFWIVLEPLFYLFAIGYGLGSFVSTIQGHSYIEYFLPALLCTTAMFVSFFEATYGNFTKLTHQKTYNTILLAPISASEIVLGELLWCASKGFLGVLGVTAVACFTGLIKTWLIGPALIVLFLLCFVFSCLGMLITSVARNYDSFIYATSGLIIPMSLMSGTYFPLQQLPPWMAKIAYVLPLTHGVAAVRSLLLEEPNVMIAVHASYLVLFAIVAMNWSAARIERRMVG
jgi:lipooligosaccharide transport system permease protein